jgi:4-amino-4-deoxy-L-arabinose transferase-like glycosyltransferase
LRLKPIHYILLFSLLIRLYHIDFPVSGWHAWRQADTASIAKNFYENGFNILYPQINWGGNTPGYVESEFQVFPFLVSLLYLVFGVNDMWGRVLALVCSLFTIYGLYLLTRKLISGRVALWSAFIYAIIPLNIYYSRAYMPESMMLMCIVLGIYYFSEWLDVFNPERSRMEQSRKGQNMDTPERTCGAPGASRRVTWFYFIISAFFVSLAILIKIPTLYIGLPLLYLAYRKYGWKTFVNPRLWLYAVLVLTPVFVWYWHAHNIFSTNGLSFGIWGFGEDKWGNVNLLIQPAFYNDVIFKSIAERHLTYAGFIPFLIGLFIKREKEGEKLFDWWLISCVVYLLIVAGGNKAHEYYQLPVILAASVFAGKAFSKYLSLTNIKQSHLAHKLRFTFFALCLLLIPVLSFLRVSNFLTRETYDGTDFKIANGVKLNSLKDDLIITVSNNSPIYLYLCERKGWATVPEAVDSLYIAGKIEEGAKLLAGDKSYFVSARGMQNMERAMKNFPVLKDDKDYFLINLQRTVK